MSQNSQEALPQLMRAVVPSGPGGPEVLRIDRRGTPKPGPGEILIRVAYAGVNRHDCNQRQRGAPPPGATDILGLEASGHVAACGAGVATYGIGDRVCALTNGGSYADYVIADAELVLPVPEGLTDGAAAALPEAVFTAWFNLVEICALKAGDVVLIHGGASGVGAIAIQLARLLGARVFATAGSEAKCAFACQQGAESCFNYRSQDFVAALQQATGGYGADIIIDMAGGLYAEKNLHALARRGRLTHLSSGQEPIFSAPLGLIMQKQAVVTGALLRPLERERKVAIAREIQSHVWPRIGHDIVPAIDKIFPLEGAAEAHAYMEAGSNRGKILLSIS
jgi:putative PIG3 family NAD(P)H quinone oxidoreductase